MPRSELALARMRHRLPAFGQTFGCRWSRRLRDSVPVPSRRSIWGGQALTFWSSRFRRVSIFVFVVVMIIDVVIRYGEFKKGKMWKFAWREKDIQFWCPISQSVISNHIFALTVGAKIRMSLVASSEFHWGWGRYRQRGRYIQGRYIQCYNALYYSFYHNPNQGRQGPYQWRAPVAFENTSVEPEEEANG